MLAGVSYRIPFVRVGGRCENEKVKEYSLNVQRKKIKYWSDNRAEMQKSLKSVKFIDTLLSFLQEGIISVDFLISEEIISSDHYSSLIQVQSVFPPNDANDSLLAWLEVFENGLVNNQTKETPTTNKTEITEDDLFLQESERRILDDDDKSKVDEKEILKEISPLFLLSSIDRSLSLSLSDFLSDDEELLSSSLIGILTTNKNDVISYIALSVLKWAQQGALINPARN